MIMFVIVNAGGKYSAQKGMTPWPPLMKCGAPPR